MRENKNGREPSASDARPVRQEDLSPLTAAGKRKTERELSEAERIAQRAVRNAARQAQNGQEGKTAPSVYTPSAERRKRLTQMAEEAAREEEKQAGSGRRHARRGDFRNVRSSRDAQDDRNHQANPAGKGETEADRPAATDTPDSATQNPKPGSPETRRESDARTRRQTGSVGTAVKSADNGADCAPAGPEGNSGASAGEGIQARETGGQKPETGTGGRHEKAVAESPTAAREEDEAERIARRAVRNAVQGAQEAQNGTPSSIYSPSAERRVQIARMAAAAERGRSDRLTDPKFVVPTDAGAGSGKSSDREPDREHSVIEEADGAAIAETVDGTGKTEEAGQSERREKREKHENGKKDKGRRDDSFTAGIPSLPPLPDDEQATTYVPSARVSAWRDGGEEMSFPAGTAAEAEKKRKGEEKERAAVSEPSGWSTGVSEESARAGAVLPASRSTGAGDFRSARGVWPSASHPARGADDSLRERNGEAGNRRDGSFSASLTGGHVRSNPGWSAGRFAWVLAVAWLAAIVQASLLSRVPVLGLRPDLVAVTVALIAWKCGPAWGGVAGVAGGFVYDALATFGLAVSPLLLFAFGAAVGFLAGRWRANWSSFLLAQGLLGLLLFLARAALAGSLSGLAPGLAGTLLFSLAAYACVAKLSQKLRRT